jgi:chromosome segregation ATPase
MSEKKEVIVRQINDLVHEVLSTIEAKEIELHNLTRQIIEAQNEYTEAVAAAHKVTNEAESKRQDNVRKEADLTKREEQLVLERSKLKEDADAHVAKLQDLIHQQAKAKEEVKRLTSEAESLQSMLKQKESAIKTLETVMKQLRDAEAELVDVTTDIEIKKRNGEKIVAEAARDAQKLISEAQDKNKEILDRAKYLTELDAKLKTKEADLLVVESRWKKLYEEKGASFKV